MIQSYIKELVQYGLNTGLVEKEDTVYTVNALLEFFGLDEYEGELPEAKEGGMPLEEILKGMLDYAAETGILKEDSVVYRDLTDTKIMSLLMPRPSEVICKFRAAYERSPEEATDYYYRLCQDSDYIRRYRIAKDMKWVTATEYGNLDITVNLSKPEKDPKAIAAAKLAKQSGYPEMPALPGERGLCRQGEPSGQTEPQDHPCAHQRAGMGLSVLSLCVLQ